MSKSFHLDTPNLGRVELTAHAQDRMRAQRIPHELFMSALTKPTRIIPDGLDIVWHEHKDIRVVICVNPAPDGGANVINTVYRVKAQAR